MGDWRGHSGLPDRTRSPFRTLAHPPSSPSVSLRSIRVPPYRKPPPRKAGEVDERRGAEKAAEGVAPVGVPAQGLREAEGEEPVDEVNQRRDLRPAGARSSQEPSERWWIDG